MEGIYAIYFTGRSASGMGLLVAKDGNIAGADAVGCLFDGTYREAEDGNIDVGMTLNAPPGTMLVTGVQVIDGEPPDHIFVRLPRNFADGIPVAVHTSTGPINAVFRRIRGAL